VTPGGGGRAPVPAPSLPRVSSLAGRMRRDGLGFPSFGALASSSGPLLSGFPSRLGSSGPVSEERLLAPSRSSTRSGRFRLVASCPVASTPGLSSTVESVAFGSIAGIRTPCPSMGFFPLRDPLFTAGSGARGRFRMSPSARSLRLLPHPSLVRPVMRNPVRVAALVAFESVRWESCVAVASRVGSWLSPLTGSKVSLRR
jgi:hypothetical protein